MALLFMDSFDHYATADILSKWTNIATGSPQTSISAGNGRHSSASIRMTGGIPTILKGLNSSGAVGIVGLAYKSSVIGGGQFFVGFYDSITNRDQIFARINVDGSISVLKSTSFGANAGGGTIIGTSASGIISANTYYYIELKTLLSTTVGTITVQVNGATVLNLTGQNTSPSSLTWNSIWISGLGSGGPNVDIDDLYVLDGSGAAPWNDFLGDVRVDARVPTAAGATTGWTPSTGSNWQNVDDATPNADTDYNATSTVGVTDTFTTQDSPVVGAIIYGVQHNLSTRKADTGPASIAPVVRHAGVDNVGANYNPSLTYVFGLQVNQTNPGTGVQWTEAGFNAAEFGYKRTA